MALLSIGKFEDLPKVARPGLFRLPHEGLATIPIPETTDTYMPVPYYDAVSMVKKIAGNAMAQFNYELLEEKYVLSRMGERMVGNLVFKNGLPSGFTVSFVNSYDKSSSFKIATGTHTWACMNLMVSGDVVEMRMHTNRVMLEIESIVERAMLKGRDQHIKSEQDIDRLSWAKCNDRTAHEIMGVAYGDDLITVRQLTKVKEEWHNPTYDAFKPRTQWSLYNAFTEAMKTTPPEKTLEKYFGLHQLFMN